MIAIGNRSAMNSSVNSNYSLSPSPTGGNSAGTPPMSEELNPITMALNAMNGQMCGGNGQQMMSTSPSLQQQQSNHQNLLASMLVSSGSSAPSMTTTASSASSPVTSGANLIFTTPQPEFVQLSIPEDNQQLLEMAAAQAGIVDPIMGHSTQQQQMQNHHFNAEDYLPITTQNQSISQMVATYATNDMTQQDLMAHSSQQYNQQYYLDQQEMQNYYYGQQQQHNMSHDEGVIMSSVGEVPHTPSYNTSQMGGDSTMTQQMINNNNNHCGRRGQFQTPPPLQSVGPISNIQPDLQSPDSGYGDICSTPKETSLGMYQQHHPDRFFHDAIFHQQQQQQQQHHQGNSYIPNGMMYSTMDTSQMSPIGSLPSPTKSTLNSTLMNSSIASSGFGPASPEIKQENTTTTSSSSHKASIPQMRITAPQIQIEKIDDPYGFHYELDTPISTAQRNDEDRMTYVNKGQFYPLTVNYRPYPNGSDNIKTNAPVKTVVMVVFRDEKNQDNELKSWSFWHARQHTYKQRILDADAKSASGILGSSEEIAHNGIAFHWSPKEGPAKLSLAVQCLSTDFSNQKGVKGVAMHLQIDTYATDTSSRVPLHRAYAQIKVFCDKGAERKTRDEERRLTKRKQNHAGRKRIEDLYHPKCDKTAFYQMADLVTNPVLFNPSELNNNMITRVDIHASNAISSSADGDLASSPRSGMKRDRDGAMLDNNGNIIESPDSPPLAKRLCYVPQRNPEEEKVIIQIMDHKTMTSPLTVAPPTLEGLANALEAKYNIQANLVEHIYRRSVKGVLVMMDNDLIRHFGNKGQFKLDVSTTDESKYRVTLVAAK